MKWPIKACWLVFATCVLVQIQLVSSANADDVEVEVKSVKLGPAGTAEWKQDGGEWQALQKGQILRTCNRIKIARAYVSVRRYECPNKEIWRDTKFWTAPTTRIHISEETVNKDGNLAGGYVDLNNGDVRIVDGPGCEWTGHCGCRGIQGIGVPVDDVGLTDYRCVQDSTGHTTTFYNSPSSTGNLGTRALVGSDTLTIHTLGPGEALRYNDYGETTVPHVGLIVEPSDAFATVKPGGVRGFQLRIFNPDSQFHSMAISLELENPVGWNAWSDTYELGIPPGEDALISVFAQAPSFPKGEVNIVYIGVTSESGDETGSSFYLEISSEIPTLTEWGLIIFGVVLLGFITWVFLKRRRVVGVRV